MECLSFPDGARFVEMEVTRYALGALTIPVVRLRDPRSSRDDTFAFQWHLETVLYGGATGGLYRLLERSSLGGCTLTVSKASVVAGAVTAERLRELIALLSESLPLESQVRITHPAYDTSSYRGFALTPLTPERSTSLTGPRAPGLTAGDESHPGDLSAVWALREDCGADARALAAHASALGRTRRAGGERCKPRA